MSEGITAEDIVELFRRDERARRELAVLLVSEPEVRLAIVNAVLREVATKEDIERLREATRQDIERLRAETRRDIERLQQAIEALRRYVDERLERLREEFRSELRREVEALRHEIEALREYVDRRIGELQMEVRELRERLWWVVGTLIAGWLAVVIEQLLLHMLAG